MFIYGIESASINHNSITNQQMIKQLLTFCCSLIILGFLQYSILYSFKLYHFTASIDVFGTNTNYE